MGSVREDMAILGCDISSYVVGPNALSPVSHAARTPSGGIYASYLLLTMDQKVKRTSHIIRCTSSSNIPIHVMVGWDTMFTHSLIGLRLPCSSVSNVPNYQARNQAETKLEYYLEDITADHQIVALRRKPQETIVKLPQ
jgi:hypothetical protein